jgi:4-hydroxybenzoate polyprenyltransferase
MVKLLVSLFQLMRPVNLAIVAFTMMVTRYVVVLPMAHKAGIDIKPQLTHVGFFLIMTTAVLLTAAGNIINDYFDQRVDQINKPEKVIIGKRIKRRVAIVFHQVFNVVAVIIAMVVCSNQNWYVPLVIPIVIATLLWFYSPVLKKKWMIGNLTVAFCTCLVPLWAALFDLHHIRNKYVDQLVDGEQFLARIELVIWIICISSFVLNLVREAIKDAEDMQGDVTDNYQTLPIVSGISNTIRYAQMMLTLYLSLMVFLAFRPVLQFESNKLHLIVFISLIIGPGFYAFWAISTATEKASFTRASSALKWMMLLGLSAVIVLSRISWH